MGQSDLVVDIHAPGGGRVPRSRFGGLGHLEDLPTLDWILPDGGALDVDRCPDLWERNAHIERYAFARKCFTGGRILDFGCGVGYGSEMLTRAGCHVVSVDTSESALTLARQRPGKLGTFLRPEQLEEDEEFDGAMAFEVLEHLENPEEFLAMMARRARHLIVSTPIVPTMATNPHHRHDFTPAEFESMVARHFRIVYAWNQIRPWHALPCYAIIHGASKIHDIRTRCLHCQPGRPKPEPGAHHAVDCVLYRSPFKGEDAEHWAQRLREWCAKNASGSDTKS